VEFGSHGILPKLNKEQKNMPVFDGCSTTAYESFIAFEVMTTHFAELRASIIDRWATIRIKCGAGTAECSGLDGAWNGRRLLICNTEQRRVGPILLHELVHACNGSELDAEAVENACYLNAGATLPTSGDYPKFCREDVLGNERNVRVSEYVIWDSDTGQIWVRARADDGSPTRGPLLFQSNRWIRRCT
jgi:hypothetical protein